jgi:eukaryotic-like serine/threonine-protein kinase
MVRGLEPGDPPLIGPYRMVGRIGSGGMGRVFLGLSAGGRPVAVKVIRAELAADPDFRVSFGREVAAARRVSGLFTALVVDADVDGPVPWLATAYVPGPSLAEAVTGNEPMPAEAALALAAGLAEGLSAIHAASVVHCDLKPSNVLLSQDGPRVIDFGISRAAEAASTSLMAEGMVVGSPGFMSPEQAVGEEVGPPSDIFSLGAVLAFAATGHGPFGEGSGPELAYRMVYAEPDLGQLPGELRPLVARCLAKEPGERPTAGELLTELQAVQTAAGWLPDAAIGALACYATPHPLFVVPAGLAAAQPPGLAAAQPPGRATAGASPDRGSRRRSRRALGVAGVAAGVIAAAAIGVALTGASAHPQPAGLQHRAAAIRAAAPGSTAPASRATSPPVAPSASSSPGDYPGPIAAGIVPAAITVRSPETEPAKGDASPSASASPAPAKSTPSPSTSGSASVSPSPTSSTSPALPVPRITSVSTYRKGVWVYFDLHYADPGKDAQGFGLEGSNGTSWVTERYPFSSPNRGIVGAHSVAYPLDLQCGTANQHKAEIEAWIYDTAGASSAPAVIDLSCSA